jgi:hypothetical protein
MDDGGIRDTDREGLSTGGGEVGMEGAGRALTTGSGSRVVVRLNSVSVLAVAAGAAALGAFAVGALAIGALAIGRLRVGDAALRRLRIDQFEVGELRVHRRVRFR